MASEPVIIVPDIFEPLWGPGRYFGAYGGRGSGKSYNFAHKAVVRSAERPGSRGVCVREVQRSLKDSAKLLIEDIVKRFGLGGKFDLQTVETKTPGGGIIVYQGLQDHTAESIKSFEGFDWAWIEEGQTLSARSLELLRPTIRKAGSEIWASWNPRSPTDPVDVLLRGLVIPPNSIVVEANYQDNQFFTPELEAEREFDYRANPDRYAHIWDGAYEPMAVGAIWSRQGIHACRTAKMPCGRERTLVAVDHAVSDIPGVSNEHGITVQALGADQRGYLLEDGSMYGTPHQWATRTVALFDKWDADAVVIERNQGGDLVRHTLQTIRRNLPIIEVVATRGKHVRAEPIAALYPLLQIFHVGTFPEIETQMCQFTSHGYAGPDSPDRAEAVIWGFTELFPSITMEKPAPPEERPRVVERAWMG